MRPCVAPRVRHSLPAFEKRGPVMILALTLLLPMFIGCSTSQDRVKKAEGYYTEGMAHFQTDRQRAFVNFQKAIQENPDHKQARYSLAHLYALQGKVPQAEVELKEAIRIDPEFSEAHNFLGEIIARDGRARDAIPHYRRALGNPLYATPDIALYNLGGALVQQGDMEGAAQAFEDALHVSPLTVPPAKLHLALGLAYYRLGYDRRARESLVQVTSLDKGGEDAAAAEKLLERLRP